MQDVTIIIAASGDAVAVVQQLHDGAAARRVPSRYTACCSWYGNGADDGPRLRVEDRLTTIAFAYQRGRCTQTILKSVRFQHYCRRAFVGQVPSILPRADADLALFFQHFEQSIGLRVVQFTLACFAQR